MFETSIVCGISCRFTLEALQGTYRGHEINNASTNIYPSFFNKPLESKAPQFC